MVDSKTVNVLQFGILFSTYMAFSLCVHATPSSLHHLIPTCKLKCCACVFFQHSKQSNNTICFIWALCYMVCLHIACVCVCVLHSTLFIPLLSCIHARYTACPELPVPHLHAPQIHLAEISSLLSAHYPNSMLFFFFQLIFEFRV